MFRVWLGLGSNKGERKQYLTQAVHEIWQVVKVEKISSIYETEPVGMEPTESFYNMALEIQTELLPPELLLVLNKIETKLGRKSDTHLQPREIDIDIELYDSYIYRDSSVVVPHPELHKRRFVLEPMNEIAPNIVHPILKKNINELCLTCNDHHSVIRVKNEGRSL